MDRRYGSGGGRSNLNVLVCKGNGVSVDPELKRIVERMPTKREMDVILFRAFAGFTAALLVVVWGLLKWT